MRKIVQVVSVFFILVVLSACSGMMPTEIAVVSTLPVIQTPSPIPSPPTATFAPVLQPDPAQAGAFISDQIPAEGLVLAAHVYADNTCYDVGIYQDGHYYILSCLPSFEYPGSTGQLNESQLPYLQRWVDHFQSFEEPSATGMIRFVGNGDILPEFSDKVSIKAMTFDVEWDAHGYVHRGGLPSVIGLSMSVLSNQLGIPLDQGNVLNFEVVDFSDTCLGAPKPDEVCAQALTQGFRIQFVSQGMLYEFHTDAFGYNIRQFGEPQIAPTQGPAG